MVVAHGAHDGGELGHLRLRQAGGRLVEQEEAGLSSRVPGRRRASARPPARAPRPALRGPELPASSRSPADAGPRAARPPSRAPPPRRSRARRARERAAVLERSGEPGPAAPVRAPASDVPIAELDRARVGKSKPVRMLTSVVFPAPLGPMSPTTSCRCTRASPPGARGRPRRRARRGGPENVSGPPPPSVSASDNGASDLRDDLLHGPTTLASLFLHADDALLAPHAVCCLFGRSPPGGRRHPS